MKEKTTATFNIQMKYQFTSKESGQLLNDNDVDMFASREMLQGDYFQIEIKTTGIQN